MSLSQTATIPAWMMSKKKYIPVIFSNGTNRRGSANVLPPLIPWLTYLYIMRSILRDYIKVKFFVPRSSIIVSFVSTFLSVDSKYQFQHCRIKVPAYNLNYYEPYHPTQKVPGKVLIAQFRSQQK